MNELSRRRASAYEGADAHQPLASCSPRSRTLKVKMQCSGLSMQWSRPAGSTGQQQRGPVSSGSTRFVRRAACCSKAVVNAQASSNLRQPPSVAAMGSMPAAAATAWNLAASARMRGLAVQARASTRTEQQTKQQEPAVVALERPQQQQQQLPSFLPQQVHQALQPALPVIRSIAKKVGSVDPRIR